ncbi:MAG: hypothetical protein U1A77_04610 [Pirellulales bacterium]
MNTENPYHASSLLPESAEGRFNPSNRTLWKAYFLAPAVAPISFVAIVLLIGLLAPHLGVEINEAGIIILPVIAGVIPPVMLSGTAFWLLLRRFSRTEAGATHGTTTAANHG